MHSKKKMVFLAAVMALALAFNCFAAASASSSDVSSLQSKLNSLEQRAKEIKDSIADLQNDASKQEQLKEQLQRQMSNTQEQISVCSNEIAELNDSIRELDEEIANKETELAETKELFKQRLRAMYMSGSDSELLILLSSDDVADYLAKTELTRSVSEHDNQMMDEIITKMQEIVAAQDQLSADKTSKESAQAALTQKQAELESQVAEVNTTLSQISADTSDLTAEQKSVQAAQDDYEDQIAAATKAAAKAEAAAKAAAAASAAAASSSKTSGSSGGSSTGTTTGGTSSSLGFIWPTPGYTYISSPFGYRTHPITGLLKLHAGIDISGSGIAGTPVLAADSGTVSIATYNSGGYGYYVMIYHGTKSDGNQYATLYGHMTNYIVSVGQHVNQGDVIGYVGSTGASTGYHLHFEIRVNGTAVNPLLYY